MAPTLASAVTLSSLGWFSKAFLNFACKDVRVQGLEHLLHALREPLAPKALDKGKGRQVDWSNDPEATSRLIEGRTRRRGVITICNHTSVVDDPLVRSYRRGLSDRMMTGFILLCPDVGNHAILDLDAICYANPYVEAYEVDVRCDIMFTNPIASKFFSLGQVIETVRGGGVFQPAIDDAIRKLDQGEWIHIFPEGKVNQPNLHPPGGMRRFKWGISRMLMDAEELPEVIPIWLSGFDDVMPDTRKYLRFLPRPGKSVSITIGQPITSKILPLVEGWKHLAKNSGNPGVGGKWSQSARSNVFDDDAIALNSIKDAQTKVNVAAQNPERQARSTGLSSNGEERRIRISICDLLYKEIQDMGIKVEQQEGKDKRPWRTAVSIDGKVHT